MPRRYASPSARPTVTLHAEWWSDAKDAHGQWKERVVLYRSLLYRDQQAQQQRLFASMNLDMGAVMALDQANLKALQKRIAQGDAAASAELQSLMGANNVSMATLAADDAETLLPWLHEMTDPDGTPLLWRNEDGTLVADDGPVLETLEQLDGRDGDFIKAAVADLQQSQQAVPVTPQDQEKAAGQAELVANGHLPAESAKSAQVIAEDSFRRDSETTVSEQGQ